MKTDRIQYITLLVIFGFLLLVMLTLDYQRAVNYFFSDETVYYMMAQSLAFDRDLEYTQQDLQRFYQEGWSAGPLGIFLNKTDDGHIYYSKTFVYSRMLAPFLILFGLNGFLVMNGLLFFLMVWMGWLYLRQYNSSTSALVVSGAFFFLSAGVIYLFWLTPEIFNMWCITTGMFFWLYRTEHTSWQSYKVSHERNGFIHAAFASCLRFGRWLVLTPRGRLYLVPIPLALASVSKPPNILFFAPVLVDILFIGSLEPEERPHKMTRLILPRLGRILLVCVVFVSIVGIFYGLQYRYTGRLNPYSGDRRTFYHRYPFDSLEENVWEQGIRLSTEDYWEKSFFFHPKTLVYNVYYYIMGRFTGMLPYFFCSLLAVYYFLRRLLRRRTVSFQERRGQWQRLLLLLTIGGSIGVYIILMPINYQGGGGAFGNRYFVNIYPAFLFLITVFSSLRPLFVSWIVSTLFLAQTFITPFKSSFAPATQAFRFPFRLLPVELTLIDTLPNLVNHHLMQTAWDGDKVAHRLYFFDENIYNMHAYEFWVKGETQAEMALRTFQQQQHIVLTITNGLVPNQVDVSFNGEEKRVVLAQPQEQQRLVFSLEKEYLPYFNTSLYPLNIRSHAGFVPKFFPEARAYYSNRSDYLGCRINISFEPLDAANAYLELNQFQEALPLLEPIVLGSPESSAVRYSLGRAYQQAGRLDEAIRELEHAQHGLLTFRENYLSAVMTNKPEALPERWPGTTSNDLEDQPASPGSLRLRYEAEELPRHVGEVFGEEGASNGKVARFIPGTHGHGFLAYGPYVTLPAGEYWVNYRINIADPLVDLALAPGHILFFLDVKSKEKEIVAINTVRLQPEPRERYNHYQDYWLQFTSKEPLEVEFRVKTAGTVPISIDYIDVFPGLPIWVYQASGITKSMAGLWEESYWDLSQLADKDFYWPEIKNVFFKTLVKLKKWDEILEILPWYNIFLRGHTGAVAELLDEISSLSPEEIASQNFPDPLTQFTEDALRHFSPAIPLNYNFQDMAELLGYDLSSTTLRAGEPFTIRYYWKALQPIQEDYTIFVHFIKKDISPATFWLSKIQQKFLGRTAENIFQQDHEPLAGQYPTSQWAVNEMIREEYNIQVPPKIEPGTYDIRIGVYHLETQERLLSEGEEEKNIGEIEVIR